MSENTKENTGVLEEITPERMNELIEKHGVEAELVVCPLCGELMRPQGKGGHFSAKHEEEDYDEYKDKFETVVLPSTPPGEEKGEEGLAKEPTDELVAELKNNLETFNLPPGKNKKQQREKIFAIIRKAPEYRNWNHVHDILDTAGVDAKDAKTICDMTFSQVKEGDLKEVRSQSAEVGSGDGGESSSESGTPSEDADLDTYIKRTMDRMTKANMIRALASGDVSGIVNEEGELDAGKISEGEMDMDGLLKTMMNRQMMLQMINSLQNGGMGPDQGDAREGSEQSLSKDDLLEFKKDTVQEILGRLKEEEKEDKLVRTLNNVNKRLSAIEKGKSTPSGGGNKGENRSDVDRVRKEVKSVKGLMDELGGSEEPNKVVEELRKGLSDLKSSMEPSGEMNEFDMKKAVAGLEADAEKLKAKEHRKAIEGLADAVRGLGDDIGWSIGESVARGGERPSGAQGSNPGSNPQIQAQGQDLYEPKPIRRKDDGTRVLEGCVWKDCDHDEDIEIEQGKSSVACPECNRVIQIPAVE